MGSNKFAKSGVESIFYAIFLLRMESIFDAIFLLRMESIFDAIFLLRMEFPLIWLTLIDCEKISFRETYFVVKRFIMIAI